MSSQSDSTSSRLCTTSSCNNGSPLDVAAQIASIVSGAGDAATLGLTVISLLEERAPRIAERFKELSQTRKECQRLIITHDEIILEEDERAWSATLGRYIEHSKTYWELAFNIKGWVNNSSNEEKNSLWSFRRLWRKKIVVPNALKKGLNSSQLQFDDIQVILEVLSDRAKEVPLLRERNLTVHRITIPVDAFLDPRLDVAHQHLMPLILPSIRPRGEEAPAIPLSDIPSKTLNDDGSRPSTSKQYSTEDPFSDREGEQSLEAGDKPEREEGH